MSVVHNHYWESFSGRVVLTYTRTPNLKRKEVQTKRVLDEKGIKREVNRRKMLRHRAGNRWRPKVYDSSQKVFVPWKVGDQELFYLVAIRTVYQPWVYKQSLTLLIQGSNCVYLFTSESLDEWVTGSHVGPFTVSNIRSASVPFS